MKRGVNTYQYSSNLLLRLIGAVYTLAFYSLSSQIHALIGEAGLLPARQFFSKAQEQLGGAGFFSLPSIFWWSASDTVLGLVCYAGMFFSVLLIIGVLPLLSSIILWFLYLSVAVAGQTFLSFQWDNLLLEAGLLAILLSPPVWRTHLTVNPRSPRIVVFLFHLLLFKLMFMSGYVKLASGDPVWRDLSALSYHFSSQPLPVWVSWYVDQAPGYILKGLTLIMFFIELVVPFFIFLGRYFRYAAFFLFSALQMGIIATGNYGFFNILTIVLCCSLLDDRIFTFKNDVPMQPLTSRLSQTARYLRRGAAAVIIGITIILFAAMFKPTASMPRPLAAVVQAVMPFRSINSYGLFAVMTKARKEIVIEGSTDGQNWRAYEFCHKPGDVYRTPLFVSPHMPRLDWQMWFAALGSYQHNPWLITLMGRLLEGQPDVLSLLDSNPFVGESPTMIRAVLYKYSFASPEENKKYFLWWNREIRGLYCPIITKNP